MKNSSTECSDGLEEQAGSSRRQPIAIIGMGCRFPGGANSPRLFWELLRDGRDAITEIPDERWNVRAFYDVDPARRGKTYARFGGFVKDLDKFDAQFFGISPREAACIDPQHRLLMEVAWEAMEDAGLPPDKLAGSSVGVFVGISTCDYGGIQTAPSERRSISAYTNLGLGMCIAANRLSYLFDFHGPSFSVDTACSSSLVAVHLACQSLWNGECSLALVGGVNAILRPEGTIGFSKSAMLAHDGHCKSFDARADGYVRSEGAGMVVLKPLTTAIRDGDPVEAIIRGTATNQDGRTGGIALPNGEAQAAMLREAYRKAEILPNLVRFIEAHGTGTSVGDPIEVRALGKVLSQDRPLGNECLLGSVKSNIGHLEAASGIAGLIKAALCVRHGEIPANLNFETPNPEIPLGEYQFRVPQQLQAWPQNGSRHRLAGVNSFGFGGSNAHVILDAAMGTEELPPAETDAVEECPTLVPLSARSPEALEALAKSYLAFLADKVGEPGASLQDISYTTSLRRAHHNHRLALVARSREELSKNLEAVVAGESRPEIARGRQVSANLRPLAFVFSGMGPQWWAMGREMIENNEVFRSSIERSDSLFREHCDWSILRELMREEDESRIHETDIAQSAIFSLQVALAAVWRSWGIEPDVVVGHSVGEAAAAYVAGVLSLEDAVRLIFHRSRLQKRTAGQGRMLSVALSLEEARTLLADGFEKVVSVAAINSPSDVTLSGESESLERIAEMLQSKDVFHSFLQVEVPYHSSKMDPLESELKASLEFLNPQPASIPMISTATGEFVTGQELDASYWWQNVRQPVHFEAAMRRLIERDYRYFLELAAHPVLGYYVSRCLNHAKKEGAVLSSLRRGEPERVAMLGSLGKLYTVGFPVTWSKFHPQARRFVHLPNYPWQRERFWNESERSVRDRRGITCHPLLGNRVDAAFPVWEVEMDKRTLNYLGDHKVQGTVMCPGAVYVEMALAAGRESFGPLPFAVEELMLQSALFLSSDDAPRVQLLCETGQPSFAICSYTQKSLEPWTPHVTGKLRRLQAEETSQNVEVRQIRDRCPREVSKAECYDEFAKLGIDYGPYFQAVKQVWGGHREALGEIELHPDLLVDASQYIVHPVLLDACFQVMLGTIALKGRSESQMEGTYLPVQIDSVRVYGRPEGILYAHALLEEHRPTYARGSVRLLDEAGRVLIEVRGFSCRAIDHASERSDSQLYEYRWKAKQRAGQDAISRPAAYLPRPREIVERLQPVMDQLLEQLGRMQFYDTVDPAMIELAIAYILRAFDKLGCTFEPRIFCAAEELAERLGVVADHRRLFERLLHLLADAGVMEHDGDQWAFVRRPEIADPGLLWKRCWEQFPACEAELMLARRCGEHLPEVLNATINPLQLIFPEGSMNTAEHLYQDSPSYRVYNTMVQHALRLSLEQAPDGQLLRVLEVGGGTGGLASYVLRVLPADRTEYVFTDLSESLLRHSEQKFQDYSFLKYQTLDIDKDPLPQGFAANSFDVILASDVLHATPDLRNTLDHLKQLLAPEGMLALLEGTRITHWAILIFGLLKGWWLFRDTELRKLDPWISRDAWHELLLNSGFTDVASLTDRDDASGGLHSVILARGPASQREVTTAVTQFAPPQRSGSWLIFGDSAGFGSDLSNRLRAFGESAVVVSPGESFSNLEDGNFEIRPGHLPDLQQLVDCFLANSTPWRGVVHAWSLDAASHEKTTLDSLRLAQSEGVLTVLQFVQVLAKAEMETKPKLWLVTGGAEQVGRTSNSTSVAQAPIWGLGRVIKNEYPEFDCNLVDLSPRPSSEEAESFFAELWASDEEDEIVMRGSSRYVHRLARTSLAEIQSQSLRREPADSPSSFSVEIPTPGVLSKLACRRRARRSPGPGEVEIDVRAASLNFKDIMVAMGLLPDEALEGGYTGKSLGMECAGDIVEVGEAVNGFEVGDAVLTCAPGALRTHLTIDSRYLVKKPPRLSYQEAATIPIAFLTAHYSLTHLARMQAGSRVLIHAAAGGVGLAAVQLAQRAGAEIFATAGTSEKRELLRALGVRHVMDSRSLAFADEVTELTNGKGVDVVLNSLSGPAIGKSLGILSPYGRFVEIGKRDIYVNSRLELRPFRNNLSYFAVDLDRLCVDQPGLVQALLKEVMEGFQDETLHPIALRTFLISNVVGAFRYMAQAKHVGKVIVSFDDSSVKPVPPPPPAFALRPDGTYLISGGLGGVGLALSNWLVEHGARNLALFGRSGASSPEAKAALDKFSLAGINVVAGAVDVTDQQQIEDFLATIRNSMPPLRGVVHAAMVIDDRLLPQLDGDSLNAAMAPKLLGAWNLHTQTLGDPLDLFICVSSFTSLFGNPGQGNYVAGNAFLDALAHHRSEQGLPALTVNWGVVGDVGYVAQKAGMADKLGSIGVKPMPIRKLLEILGQLIRYEAVQAGVAEINWQEIARLPLVNSSPRFSNLVRAMATENGEGLRVDLLATLQATEPAKRQEFLIQHICQQLAKVLGTTSLKLDTEQPLLNMGLDSLMALEIGNQIQSDVGVKIPPMKFMEGLTISGLAALVIERLAKEQPDTWKTDAPALPLQSVVATSEVELAEQVDLLSERQVDVMLLDLMDEKRSSAGTAP
jgi:acyl transferase domain-containing protein/NADPH:quinone reductase-like Zn-dependent oxidoreductase/SAM-dependent methyltransferase/acyl carrier protein